MAATAEEKAKYTADFRMELVRFTNEELAWDFHCCVWRDSARAMIIREAESRNLNLCSIVQVRRNGPPFINARYMRPVCGRFCDTRTSW